MKKILTILIPTYNMQTYLRHCLDSLIVSDEQMRKLEVLVINDGSIDNSSNIAHEYEAKYPNSFRVIDKENGNYGSCINKGLQIATGKYVKVLDADDSFDTTYFGDYLRFLNNTDVDMIITPYTIVDEIDKEKSREEYDLPINTLLTWEQLTPAFKKKSLQMHAVTYKRQNLIDIHYRQTEGISYTDQEWIFTPLTAVKTAVKYPHAIYRYLYGRKGQTTDTEVFRRNISHNELCCRRIVKDYKSFGAFEPHKQEYIDFKFHVTMRAMYNWYLIIYPDLDITQLVLFDDYVRSVDASYIDLLDAQTLKFTNFHYIKQWHNNRGNRIKIPVWYHLYSLVINRICSICSIS